VRVKQFVSKVPVPICGLSLGLASLDRFLWYNHGDVYTFNIFALFSFMIAILFTLRIFTDAKGILRDIEGPAVFAVLPTYTMTLILLAAYVKDHAGGVAGDISFIVWMGAVIASYALLFVFIKRFVFKFGIEKVFPGWFVIFIGYVVASVTSASFGTETLGQVLFWSGIAGYAAMLPLLLYRTLIVRNIPAPLVPQIAIFAAPANLCAVGCLTVYAVPPEIVIYILTVMGVISYVAVLCYLPIMLRRKFHPSFAALTFPMVISAVSFYRLGIYYGISANGVFAVLQGMTTVIAATLVICVLIAYIVFLYGAAKAARARPS